MNLASLRPAKDFAQRFGCKSIVYGPAGSGKCLAPGTSILMFDGSIKIVENIKIGDLLMGPDSDPKKVIGLAHGQDDMFDIIPTKGAIYRVNSPHILSLWYSGKKEIVNIPVNKYLDLPNHIKHDLKGWRAGVEFSTKTIFIHPYLLGLWLGDGSSDEIAFHTKDKEIVDFLNKIAPLYNASVKMYDNKGKKCPRYRLTGEKGKSLSRLRDCFNHYSLFNNKHVPFDFKSNSKEIRLNVLAGLLDSDGYLGSNVYSYTSVLEILADDICYLARSVGLAAYKRKIKKECVNNGIWGDYYQVSISGNVNIIPCQLKRKQATPRKQKKDVLVTGIKVEYAGYGEYFGFELEGDGLFLLGDFTVTHNTPVINTAPRPLLLATEPGLLSMRGSTVPTFCAPTGKLIDEFFAWFFTSNEVKQFDTLAIDSGTEIAEINLKEAEKTNKHGLAAYGEMARETLKHLDALYYMQEKHIYLIAKQDVGSDNSKRPYWPGKELPTKMPHKYDQILHLDIHNVPAMGQMRSFQCAQTFDIMSRDRTGMLAMFEPPDFGLIIKKVMS